MSDKLVRFLWRYRHFLFMTLIVILMVIIGFASNPDEFGAVFHDDYMSIQGSSFEFNIAYTDVVSVEYTAMPDPGEEVSGINMRSQRSGDWENDTWGQYTQCTFPGLETCVVVRLNDGRTIVFNSEDDAQTKADYETFLACLP